MQDPIMPMKMQIVTVLGKTNIVTLLKLKIHITFNPVISFLEVCLIKSKWHKHSYSIKEVYDIKVIRGQTKRNKNKNLEIHQKLPTRNNFIK